MRRQVRSRWRHVVPVLLGLTVVVAAVATLNVGDAGAQPGSSGVVSFGDAANYGAPTASQLVGPVTGIAADPAGGGYWLVAADGGVFSYGDAPFYGSLGGTSHHQPVVGMAATPDGKGYWEVTDLGVVSAYGDATAYPPLLGGLDAPMVGIAGTTSGKGYWLVAADGGVFTYGDAPFYGSMGGEPLNQPIVGMAATPDGKGYWLVAADGGIFSFGDAPFYGSMGASPPSTPVVGMARTSDGGGYWLATSIKTEPVAAALPSVVADCNVYSATPAIEPAAIVLACGDGNARLTSLTWTSWTPSTATATGLFTHNTCTPDCAQGTFVSTPTSVRLADPVQTVGGREFAQVAFTRTEPSAPGGVAVVQAVIPTTEA